MPRDSHSAIEPDELMLAYRLGYFPMAQRRDDPDVVWVLPETRGALPLADARLPKRLRRTVKADLFEVRVDTDFAGVIAACAAPAPGREDTWINDAIVETYCELHYRGVAHSVECYDGDGRLAGGLYGVQVGGVFCGESMFSRATDASKVAMAHLMARLIRNGFAVLDTQFFTEHLSQFGVREMPDAAYQQLLAAHRDDAVSFLSSDEAPGAVLSATTVAQSITQMS
ncbi:MAG: leucyl/phenylalanyl-tRNA--protein transferase [Pseudomonadota bacterium]